MTSEEVKKSVPRLLCLPSVLTVCPEDAGMRADMMGEERGLLRHIQEKQKRRGLQNRLYL